MGHQEKVLHGEAGWSLEKAHQGSGHSTESEFKKHLDDALSHTALDLDSSARSRYLDSILMGPFQLQIHRDSIL